MGSTSAQEITVDEAYILESILDPRAKIVEPVEPGDAGPLRGEHFPQERNDLVQFIKQLKPVKRPIAPSGRPVPWAHQYDPQTTTSPEKKP